MKTLDDYLNEIYSDAIMNNYMIRPSPIHGNGVFSKGNFNKGDFINTHISAGNVLSQFGAFLNHSSNPTGQSIKQDDGSYKTYALTDIKPNDEITLDYTQNKELEQPEDGWK